jgi:Ca-activated chloride channel family protein
MSIAFESLHFIRPLWLLGLIPVVGISWYLRKSFIQTNPWATVCDPHLLLHLFKQDQMKQIRQRRWIVILLMWIITLIALAGPAWSQSPSPLFHSLVGRVIVLDLSSTMAMNDLNPTRYERAKFKIIDLLSRPYQGQTSLIAYSGKAYVVSPLTLDAETIIAMLPELNPSILPKKGNDLIDALNKAVSLFHQSGLQKGEMILVTASPWDKIKANKASILRLAQQFHQQGYTLSVLGVGVPNLHAVNNVNQQSSEPLDIASLQQLATAGGGRYITFTNDDADLDFLLRPETNQIESSFYNTVSVALKLHKTSLEKNSQRSENSMAWKDQGPWFIFLLLLVVLIGFRRGWLEIWS